MRFILLYVVWVSFHRWCHAPVAIIVSRFAHTGSLISGLWTGSLFWDGVKKSRGEGRKRVLFFLLAIFSPFSTNKEPVHRLPDKLWVDSFSGALIYSTDNEVACVADFERERRRERGNLGAREIVWGARGRKKRKKEKVPLLPPPSSLAWSRALIPFPFPFPFERLPRRLMTRRSRVLLKDGIEQRKKRCGNIFSANFSQKYIDVLDDMVRDYSIGLDKNIWIFSLWDI